MSLSEPRERNASLDAEMEKLERAYFHEIMIEHGMMDHMDDSVLGDGTLESLDGQTMASLDNRVKRIPQLNDSDAYYQPAKSAPPPPRQHSRRSSPTTSTEFPIPTERVKDATIHSGRISRILSSSPISRLLNTTPSAAEGHTGMISRLLSSASSGKLFNATPSTPERSGESDRTTSGFRTHNVGDASVHSGRFSKFLRSVSAIRSKLVNAAPSTPERSRKSDRTKFGDGSGSGTSSDGEMFPESPPGFRGVVDIPSSEHDDGEETGAMFFTLKQKYKIAACLGVFLLVGISVCAAALSNIQEQNTDSNTSSQSFDDWDWTFKPTQQVSSQPTLSSSPTMAPITSTPTASPTTPAPTTPMPTHYPTTQPSASPTDEPTITTRPTQTPTMAPTTPQPTPSPTRAPTPQPTPEPPPCFERLETSKSCFEMGETIEVEFGNCDPLSDDWVGLYDSSADPDNLDYPLLWLWSCGDQICRQAIRAGDLDFDASSEGLADWPLQEGIYKVYLLRNSLSGSPYERFRESREIRVADSC